MSQMGEQCNNEFESFNAVLAGVLISKNLEGDWRIINAFDFFNILDSFEREYSVTVISDYMDIKIPIHLDDNCICIKYSLKDFITIDNKKMTVGAYLYSFTTERVREFLNINKLEEAVLPKKVSFLKRVLKLS